MGLVGSSNAEQMIRGEQDVASELPHAPTVEHKYDRFPSGNPTSDFWIGKLANLSGSMFDVPFAGVGRDSANHWGTLIAGGFYVSADHARPVNNGQIMTFFASDSTFFSPPFRMEPNIRFESRAMVCQGATMVATLPSARFRGRCQTTIRSIPYTVRPPLET